MKGFKKLALVSAIAALPVSGFAMEAMDDEALGDVTGQDGISIGLSLNQTLDVLIHDTDGLTGVPAGLVPATIANSGGIFIDGMGINGDIDIEIDAGGSAGTGLGDGVLVVQIGLGNGFQIDTGDIQAVDVEDAGGNFTTGVAPTHATSGVILDTMNINFGTGASIGIQLGTDAENFMNIVNGNIGTLNITGFCLDSNDSCGGIATSTGVSIDTISMSGIDLAGTTAALTVDGLELTLGSGLSNVGIGMENLSLDGGEETIGDVWITGLDLENSVVTINGK